VLILDDVGYVQQSPEEAETLFTLLAERYERRSVFITSNLIFAHVRSSRPEPRLPLCHRIR
jgi:DNA replication protein DnaC